MRKRFIATGSALTCDIFNVTEEGESEQHGAYAWRCRSARSCAIARGDDGDKRKDAEGLDTTLSVIETNV